MDKKIKQYEVPSIKDHGDLAELTAGRKAGVRLDATFPSGTPFTELTATSP